MTRQAIGCPAPPRRAVAVLILCAACLIAAFRPALAGGPYPSGLPADPGFFPLGVWLQSPRNAAEYRAIGINTFVDLYEGPTEAQLAELAQERMFVIAEQNDIGLGSPNRGAIKGWFLGDEPDNAQPVLPGVYGPCIPAATVARRAHEIKARDPTRPVMVNFGRGVADDTWPGRGSCTGDTHYYDAAAAAADILSFDIYPVANAEDRPQVRGRLDYVARGVAALVRHAADGQSVWSAIETTAIKSQHRVTPAQLRAEVWMALIHGARGIYYFVHEWTGGFREDAIFRYPEIVREVAALDRTIGELAPVLNSPSLDGRIAVSADVPIATMVKQRGDALYIFVAAMQDQASSAHFTIAGLEDAEATVIGEERIAAVRKGVLQDAFAGYGVHLYRVPLPAGTGGNAR